MSDYRECEICGVYEFDDFHTCQPPLPLDEETLYKIQNAVWQWRAGNFDRQDKESLMEFLDTKVAPIRNSANE